LQSELHESLFESLRDITARVKAALGDGDTEEVDQLALEHKTVMNKLNQAGFSTNANLIDLVKELSDEVRVVIAEIGKRRDKIGGELVTLGKRKEMAYAYARNAQRGFAMKVFN
jgi:predicted transcriptional regulator